MAPFPSRILLAVLSALALSAAPLFCQEGGAREAQAQAEPRPAGTVYRIALEEKAITGVTVGWVIDAIEQAEDEGAECLVLVLDTPGGLVDATRSLVKAMVSARVPVVVHVPAGGRAASAGMFITLAAHVASMAPGTNIGAATPVQLGGLPTGPSEPGENQEPQEPAGGGAMERKIVNDTRAWAESLAELRGRNAQLAADAVNDGRSVSAEVAVAEGLVDLSATDVPDLLRQIDGRTVELLTGPVTLRTAGAGIVDIEPWWGQGLLAVLASPNVAFLLMILGFYGLLFEMYSPGWGVAGVVGAVLLVLGMFGLSYLPVDYAGLLLIALALGMFVAEAFVTSFGALAAGGVVCLVFGALMLVDSPEGFMQVSLTVVLPIALATAGITFYLVSSVLRTHRQPAVTGTAGLLHEQGTAAGDFQEQRGAWIGKVRLHGEIWKARAPGPIEAGQPLRVTARDGLTLDVAPADDKTPSHS